ncbi:MAG: hypothetical protein ACJAZX_001192 [Rickettsiales bacterium]|jgi:hypothetical protein
MPRGYPALTKAQKQEITSRIKDKGEKVSDLSRDKSEAIATRSNKK